MSSFNAGSTANSFAGLSADPAAESHADAIGQHFQANEFSEADPYGLGNVSLTAGRLAGTSLSGALTSERFNTLLKKMQELASDKNNNSNIAHHVISLDKSVAPSIHFACIIIAVQSKINKDAGIGYQVLIVDGTNTPLQALESTTNMVTESLPRFAESVWDNDLRALALQRVLTLVPNAKQDNVFFSAPVVIGEETDHTNERQVFEILQNASLAASTTAARHSNDGRWFKDLNLAGAIAAKKVPELHISHSPSASVVAPDQVGNISRISFTSKLQTGKANKKDYAPNSGKAAQTLMEVGTFADLLPVLPTGQQAGYGMQPNWQNQYQMQQPAPLIPLVVINAIRSQFSLTPGATELGIVLASDQVRSNRWTEDFRHKGNTLGNSLDLADVASILVNMPDPTNPNQLMRPMYASDPAFTDNHLWELLGRYVRNTPMVAMDIPEAGAASWYMGLYAAAAAGRPAAIKLIHDSIDTLTGGVYKQLIAQLPTKQAPAIFTGSVYYMERGHWRLGDRILPIELLDNYVAVCCYARQMNNPGLVNEYVDTITGNRAQITRINHRRKILNEMAGGNAVFTRSVKRVIFNNEHRTLVNQAFNQANITMHSEENVQFNLIANSGYASNLANVAPMGASLNVTGMNNGSGGLGGGNSFGF